MDDAADLRARRDKALEFEHVDGERRLTLRAPTRTELREAMHRNNLLAVGDNGLVLALLQHYLLLRHIVAWQGVRMRDVMPGSTDAAPLPWSADAVALYLDANPQHEAAMGTELIARAQTRNQKLEDDAKN